MAAPDHAYPIGKPARDGGKPEEIAAVESLPEFQCLGCNHVGKGEHLLGVNDEETMWCPRCRTSGWVWL